MSLGGKLVKVVTIFAVSALTAGTAVWYYIADNWQFGNDTAQTAKIVEKVVSDSYIKPRPLYVRFSEPVAKPSLSDRPLDADIKIEPTVRGEWRWFKNTTLSFTPEIDFLPDTKYYVTLPKTIFSPKAKVKDTDFSFVTPKFKGKVTNSQFYEDPRDAHNKTATATFEFNYPLNPESVENGVKIETLGGDKYGFTYKLNEEKTQLHIISAPLKLGQEAYFAKISVFAVENGYNNRPLADPITAKIEIPSTSSFFKVESVRSMIVRNEQQNNRPEQVMFVNFSTAVNAADLKDKFDLYFVSKSCDDTRELLAKNKGNAAAIEGVQQLELKDVSRADEGLKTHAFQYNTAKPFGCLIGVVRQNLQSAEGYELAQDVTMTAELSPYPLEVGMMTDGAILARNGSHEVAFFSRGVNKLDVTVSRIDVENMNHLVTQTGGDFAHPFFTHYDFTEENISEVFEKTLRINSKNPAEANYSSLDLNTYFKDKKGIFVLRLVGYSDDEHSSNIVKRLIVITDLGIVVKENIDGSHNVFVADITTQEPVAEATVEVLGKNGLSVLRATTNDKGMALIPNFESFKHDKEPVVYKVTKGNDVSFLPIGRADRYMNFSRFDIGGEYDFKQGDYMLKSSMFSDRGIYRPGETAYFGIIVRQSDLNAPKKLPLSVEVRNPNGDVVTTSNLQADDVGFAEYKLDLTPTAPVGQYTLTLYVKGGNNQQHYIADLSFKVEEFLPDTLKIKAAIEGVSDKGWTIHKNLKAAVDLHNLYGNPAASHTLKAKYTLTPTIFRFKEFPDYVFMTPNAAQKRQSYEQELPDIKTDETGKGVFDIDISSFQDGPYGFRFYIDGLELGGGRGVKTSLGVLTAEPECLIGWKSDGDLSYIHKDAQRRVSFIAIDNTLQKIERKDLMLKLVRKDYISSLVEQENGLYRYQMVPKEVEVWHKSWQITNQGTSIELKTDKPGEYKLVVENADGTVAASAEYNVAGAANLTHAIDREAGLGLKLNHNEYAAGDKIEMQITAPYTGYGLITIERDSVYAYKWFKAPTTSVTETITLPDTVEGNAYVNVAFFRDAQSSEIYMPALSYAAVPFNISHDKRLLQIDLNVPAKVKSGEELVVHYKTPEKAKILIYGVNQGILQVARYAQPNPLAEFLKKKALRVWTTQIMDLIMPDIRILRHLKANGGDDSYEALALEKNLNPFARKNAKPVAFWSGIIKSDGKGGTYRYAVPESFNGEIKVIAVAVSENRFGSADQSVLARSDFALVPSGPLNVVPNDEFVIGLSVGNLVENSGNDYKVKVSADGGSDFEIIGDKTQTVSIKENGEKMLYFRFKTLQNLGAAEILFTAQSIKDERKKSVMPYNIGVRPATLYQSKFKMGHARAEYKLDKAEDLYAEYRVQQLSASVSPMVLAGSLLKYLDKFPHYCTEQTVSKVFPAVEVFFKYPKLLENTDVYALYDDAVTKLYERQTLNGGFSAWNVEGATADAYASVYAAHFLVLAQQHNFNVPAGMLQRVLGYCEAQAVRAPDNLDDFIPAYATYVLTLDGRVTTNYLLNLEEYYKQYYPKTWKKSLNASFMAASYGLLQDKNRANSLAGRYENGSDTALDAINDYLTAKHFPDIFKDNAKKDIERLLKSVSDGNFTTKSAAWATLAFNALDVSEADKGIRFSAFKPQMTPFPTVDFTPETKNLTVTSDEPFYYTVSQQGFVRDAQIAATAEGMEIEKAYYDKNGQRVTSAKIGDELTVVISYRGFERERYADVAIVDLLAGCFETVSNSVTASDWLDAAEIREDRVIAYVNVGQNTATVSYKVKVVAAGNWTVPAVFATALYQPLVRANSDAFVMTVDE